jgi:hypothetical protein
MISHGYRRLVLAAGLCLGVAFGLALPCLDTFAQGSAQLTPAVLDNAIYRPRNADVFGDTVQLVNGQFQGTQFPFTDISQNSYVFGDINGDGVDDAVAITLESLSGVIDGLDVGLTVYLNDSGVPRYADSVELGHGTQLDPVSVQAGTITVSGRYALAGEPFCCPSHTFRLQVKLVGNHLVDAATGATPSFVTGSASPAADSGSGAASGAPVVSAAGSDSGGASETVPTQLTDSVQADVLAAIDRANAAWTRAGRTLDGSTLSTAVEGQALSDDQAEIAALRSQGHSRKSTNVAFSVGNIALDSPGRAVVNTRETWSEEIDDATTGRAVQPARSASYSETYVVEFHDDGWIVTRNDLH